MTANQIAYWNMMESKRSNLARERETYRSNVARETETHRNNTATEALTGLRDAETKRNNLARLAEEKRNNIARLAEDERTHRVKEAEDHRTNVFNEQIKLLDVQEKGRANQAGELLKQTDQVLKQKDQDLKSKELQIEAGKAAGDLSYKLGTLNTDHVNALGNIAHQERQDKAAAKQARTAGWKVASDFITNMVRNAVQFVTGGGTISMGYINK